MDFNDYQRRAGDTAVYPAIGHNIIYPTLGLLSEAGEIANVVKKIFRDHGGEIDEGVKDKIALELGDALWYIARIAAELDIPLEQVASRNLDKLRDRQSRGAIHGYGDYR